MPNYVVADKISQKILASDDKSAAKEGFPKLYQFRNNVIPNNITVRRSVEEQFSDRGEQELVERVRGSKTFGRISRIRRLDEWKLFRITLFGKYMRQAKPR